MTDKEKLLHLLAEFGIDSFERVSEDKIEIEIDVPAQRELRAHGKVRGYSGFMNEFVFDKDGNFVYMGIWE